MTGLRALLPLCFFLLPAMRVVALDNPIVFRASDPIAPGQTALLFGDNIGERATVVGARLADQPVTEPPAQPVAYEGRDGQKLTVLQASNLCAKVVLPADWQTGVYALRVSRGREESAVIYLNRTEPWWWISNSDPARGGSRDVAQPGQDIRVFGKNFGPQTRAWLVTGALRVLIPVVKAEKYTATFRLPESIEPGKYALWVHNGYGGLYGFGNPLAVTVEKPTSWPDGQYNVRDFGARGDYVTDDTPAFSAALAAARQHDGGIVFVPRGQYKITGKLTMPPHTILRGEKREVVWLFVPKDQPEFDAVIAGNGAFAVENLSIVAQTVRRLIACPDDPNYIGRLGPGSARLGGANVHLAHLRLQLLRYAHRVPKNDPRRQDAEGPVAISLSGPEMWLQDLDITSSGMPIEIQQARHCRIEGCTLGTGRNGWYGLWNFEEGIFEGNDIHAVDLEGTYGGVQNNAYRLYFANNNWHSAYGGEREALSFDSPYYSIWMGMPATVHTDSFAVAGQQWAPDALRGQACLVVNGKGLGQYRLIKSNTADAITLDSPWAVTPDQTSVISIQANKTDVVVTNNKMSDASAACQLYSQCYGFIVDGNQAERTGGMYGNGWDAFDDRNQQRRFSCCYFNQWLNNRLSQGFVYEQGGSSNALLGPRIDIIRLDKPTSPPHAVMVLGNIIRDNQVQDQTTIGAVFSQPVAPDRKLALLYAGRDTIIEGNSISDADVGIDVFRFYIDTLIRNNHIERCKTPISDRGMNTWTDGYSRVLSH